MPRAVNDTRDLETVGSGSVAVWLDFAGRYREGIAVRTPDGWRLAGAGFPSFPLVEDGRLTVARLTVADRWPSGFTTVELMEVGVRKPGISMPGQNACIHCIW